MSGIYGFMKKETADSEQYAKIMDYWNLPYGKDDSDVWKEESVFVGGRLEHLTDEYPMSGVIWKFENEIWVVDAILYNREELADLLSIQTLSKFSDEELLILLVHEKGFDALKRINGDFAGAVYHIKEQKFTLFRDHMGVRPLFYYMDESMFAFSTDIRGIIALPEVNLSLNRKKFYLNMVGGNDLSIDQTEFEYIRCVTPASVMVVSDSETGLKKNTIPYWELGTQKIRYKTEKEYQDQLRNLITDAIDRRLKAVPGLVGVELSGGLDSSVVAILINRLGRKACHYSWSYDPQLVSIAEGEDERKIIEDICQQENISCFYSRRKNELEYLTQSEIEHWTEESGKPSLPYLNTWTISSGSRWFSHQGARVVFTGHGGDEGVSHRSKLVELAYHKEYPALIRALYNQRKERFLPILRTLNAFRRMLTECKKCQTEAFASDIDFSKYLNPKFLKEMSDTTLPELRFGFDPVTYIKNGGSRPRLDNVALQGAAYGVRYMVPFLDYRVIDFAVSIPRSLYNNGIEDRLIYRKTFEDILPASLRHVAYKDTPSMRNDRHMKQLHPDREQKETVAKRLERCNAEVERYVKSLDHEYWEEYLDFDAFEKMKLKEGYTEEDYELHLWERPYVYICMSIQETIKNTREWTKNHIK